MKFCLLAALIVLVNVASSSHEHLYPESCTLPLETGPCRAAFRKFGFNPATGICEEFIYGGCEGNANFFGSKQECEIYCSILTLI